LAGTWPAAPPSIPARLALAGARYDRHEVNAAYVQAMGWLSPHFGRTLRR
jgi:hypothetical protein